MATRALLVLLLAVGAAVGQSSQREVRTLPGWSGPLPSRVWSGYTDVGLAPESVAGDAAGCSGPCQGSPPEN